MKWILILSVALSSMAFAADQEKSDPTKNVMSLVEAAVKRLDDINVIQDKAINEKLAMFMQNSKDLAAAEKSRIDAIRAFDTNAAQIDRERATTQARVLAEQVESSRENLRLLVATTAEATTKQNASIIAELNKRVSDLEKIQNATIGASGGVKELWPIIVGVIMLLIAIASFIVPKLKAEPNNKKDSFLM